MIGKVQLESVTYRQFCARVRKKATAGARFSGDELYREWNRTLNRYGSINYAASARRIEKRRHK